MSNRLFSVLFVAPEERNIVKELQRLVDKVEEMKTQRALLMLQLRDSLRNDDITDQLAITDEDKSMFPAMVQKEIGKHQNVVCTSRLKKSGSAGNSMCSSSWPSELSPPIENPNFRSFRFLSIV